MRGRVRRQPADGLLPLPAGADRPSSSRLVCEDDRMDEALEEVALVVTRGAPGELERLVRREPLAGACELEPALVFSADGVIFARRQWPRSCSWGSISSFAASWRGSSPLTVS